MAFRDSPFQGLKAPLTLTAAAVAIVAGIAALGVFLTDHKAPGAGSVYGPVRGEFDEALEPVLSVLSAPVHWVRAAGDYASDYVFAINQNRQLKAEIADLKRWRDAAVALKDLNLKYEALLKLKTEPPIPMVTARAVGEMHGPFSDARLIDAGSVEGVRIGNPAMSEDGVVGRVVGVAPNASRILLLTDVQSRTPVLVNRSDARAILSGDGGPNPKLEFLRGGDAVKDGDVVLTSGDGGVYPRGLPVGVAARDFRGVWRVRLYSDKAGVDFVRVLLFNGFAEGVDQAALSRSALPPLTREEQAQNAAALAAAAKPPPPAPGAASPAAPGAAAASAPSTAAPAAKPVPVKAKAPPKAAKSEADEDGAARASAPSEVKQPAAKAPEGGGGVP